MLQRLFIHLWSLRHEFTKYFIIGIFGVVLDMSSMILFKEMFGWAPITAVIVNQAFLLVYVFLLNKYWSFRNKEMPHKQIVRFLTLAGFNYVVSIFAMYFFNHRLEFDYRLVRLVTIAMAVSWNFFLYKYWVYA